MKVNTNKKIIDSLLSRGVEDILVKKSLEEKLLSGKKLKIKFGIDPTSSQIHLGRAVVLRKLRQFQDLGHQIILIIGDFTALIGDPSDKLAKRPMLSSKQIKDNLKNYLKDVKKILDLKKTKVVYNSHWLAKLNFAEICLLADNFSVSQMLERRNFKERFTNNQEISLREFMYPLMQGYDSVKVASDVELGGFDQLFNMKAGRWLQKYYSLPEQDILTVAMLEGTDGRKMSSSWGNTISLSDEPDQMYGKLMGVKDELIGKYFLLCTDWSEEAIEQMITAINQGDNPRDWKMKLAWEVVNLYHGQELANRAQNKFIELFQKKSLADDLPTITASPGDKLVDVLLQQKQVASKSAWRRLVVGGGVEDWQHKTIIDHPEIIIDRPFVLRLGKKKFLKIKLK